MKITTLKWLAALFSLTMIMAACGSDAADTEADADTQPDAEEGSTDAETTGGIADAVARVEAFRQPQGSLPVAEALSELPTGSTAAYIQCGVPVCEEIRIGIAGAAEELGMELVVFNHDDTPENVASAWQAAVDAGVDVVLASGNPREWFPDQLAALEAAGVPVIVWSVPEGYEPGSGITANLLTIDDYYFYGALLADYAVAQTNGEGKIVFFGLPAFPVLGELETGFTEEMGRVCPDCAVENVSIDLASLGAGEVPGQVVSTLQANPDASHLIFAFGGMMFGVPEALADAELDVPAASQAGGALNFGFIAAGNVQTAEVALASEFLGWRAMDAAARALAGQDVGRAATPDAGVVAGRPDILASGLPLQILEQDDMGFLETDANLLWPGIEDFKAQYAELWGS